MALSNSKEIAVGSTQYGTWYLKLVLTESSYSIAGNFSYVKRELYLRCSNTSSSISFDTRSAWIGTNKQTIGYTQSGASHLLFTDTVQVSHNADGSGSYSSSFGISTSYILSGSSTCALTLTKLPRATKPSLSVSSIELGEDIVVTLPRAVDSYTHDLSYQFSTSGGSYSLATGVGASYTWTVPLSLANNIQNAESAELIIKCETYNGDEWVGNETVKLTVIIPSNILPSISSFTVSEAEDGLTGKFGAFVKDKSKLNVNVEARGAYASTIKSYRITIDNIKYMEASFTTETLKTAGVLTLLATVTDSRNRSTTKGITINVEDYFTPKITTFTANRCTADGTLDDANGDYIKFIYSYDIAPVNNENDKEVTIQYVNGDMCEDILTLSGYTASEASSISPRMFDLNTGHSFRLRVADYFTELEITKSVTTGFSLINYHPSGNGLAFGKVAENENEMDVNLRLRVRKGIIDEDGNVFSGGGGDTLPIGSVVEWDSDTIPTNWLLLDGQEVSRTEYNELFDLYGTRYGEGDGSTTFNLPNRCGKVSVGLDSTDSDFNALGNTGGEKGHTLTSDEIPSHYHSGLYWSNTTNSIGLNDGTGTALELTYGSSGRENRFITGSVGGGQAHENMPPYMVVNFIVKAKQTKAILREGTIVDNLDSDDSTMALSARMGNELDNKKLDKIIYSTSEQLTGNTWIDGKPIYRKVFQITIPTTSADGTLVASSWGVSNNVEEVIDIKGFADIVSSSTYRIYFPVWITTSNYKIYVRINNGNELVIMNYVKAFSGATAYITVEYTKTID